MKKAFSSLAILIASVSSAWAADIPEAAPYVRAPVVMSPAYNWTGFYIGAMGGYGWANRAAIGGFTITNVDVNGGFGGGTVGFNYQAPNSMFLVGIEADGAWSDVEHTIGIVGLASFQERITSFGSVTARAGVAIDSALIYAKGGYGWAENRISVTLLGLAGSESHFHNGWTAGGGVEFAFAGPWSAKAEYMYARYLPENYVVFGGASASIDVQTIKAGVNYRFGWGGPVVARY